MSPIGLLSSFDFVIRLCPSGGAMRIASFLACTLLVCVPCFPSASAQTTGARENSLSPIRAASVR